jgi:uncharacterized paraquat-inducible protein A
MHDESTNPARPAQARTHKRCPACGASKPLSEFYTTPSGAPSGYCKRCQRAVSRRSRRRRNAALRALIALYPEAWRAALQHDPDRGEATEGGGSDVA